MHLTAVTQYMNVTEEQTELHISNAEFTNVAAMLNTHMGARPDPDFFCVTLCCLVFSCAILRVYLQNSTP